MAPKKRSPASDAAAILSRMRKHFGGGRPPVLKRCKFCGEKFSAREIRAHIPRCPKR